MSYTKLEIHYLGDGINYAVMNSREGEKHRAIILPKKVQEYGDKYGYESLSVSFLHDHIIIKHGTTLLMDKDFNGTANNEYIRELLSYEWIGEDGSRLKSKIVAKTEPIAEVKTEENVNLVEEIKKEATDEFIEKNEDNGYVDGYLVYSDDTKTTLLACSTAVTGEIIIPNSVVSIGEYAFRDCKSLSSVTIPNSVTSIGDRAFWECSALTSVVIPNSVTSIGASAFSSCSSLTSVHITDLAAWFGISFRGNAANPLYYAHNLYLKGELIKELVIPNSVTNIGQYAFEGCSSLTSITIHNSVISIGRNAFSYCSGLMSVTIPNSVTSIGKDAFYRCSSLTSITIPNSVTSIGDYTFAECESLTSITLPNSVISIGSWAFYICKSLTFITIPNSVTSIGEDAFALCFKLTSITIPNSVTSIGKGAFRSCDALTSVTIENEEGKVVIGKEAFPSTAKINYVGKPKEQPAKPAEKEIAQAKPEAPKATTQANPSLLAKLLKIVKSIFHSTNQK